jgi:hypothetical protein
VKFGIGERYVVTSTRSVSLQIQNGLLASAVERGVGMRG